MNIHSCVTAKAPDSEKPDAILDAALELFVERGFHGTAVPLVAERAGVGAGTIYRYFESKEALVNALYRRSKEAISARVLERFPVDKPAREQFRAVWERMAEFALAHPKEFAFLELHHHGSYLDAQSQAMEDRIIEFGIAMVQKAQRAMALKAVDPTVLMMMANGAFIGVFRAGVEKKIPFDKKTFMTVEQCVWEAIRA